jgi:hypothetical protein
VAPVAVRQKLSRGLRVFGAAVGTPLSICRSSAGWQGFAQPSAFTIHQCLYPEFVLCSHGWVRV